MKRFGIILAFLLFAGLSFCEGFKLSGGIGFAYMNHYGISKYKVDSDFKKMLEKELLGLTTGNATVETEGAKKMYNSMMVGLELRAGKEFTYNEFGGYFSLNVGIPYNVSLLAPSPMDVILQASSIKKLNSSFIADTQGGLYINLFTKRACQLYIGTGLAFNWVKSVRELPVSSLANLTKADGTPIDTSSIGSISEQNVVKMVGVGINIGLTYYFSNSIGIFFSINDSCYFRDIGSEYSLIGKLVTGQTFSYKIAKDGKISGEDVSSFGRNTFANNFGIKGGFAFRI